MIRVWTKIIIASVKWRRKKIFWNTVQRVVAPTSLLLHTFAFGYEAVVTVAEISSKTLRAPRVFRFYLLTSLKEALGRYVAMVKTTNTSDSPLTSFVIFIRCSPH